MKTTRVVLAGLAFCLAAPAQDEKQWKQFFAETTLSLTEAIDRGIEKGGKGFVYHAELELDAGKLVYSIDTWQGDGGVNVVLDARTGEVLEQVDEPTDVGEAVGLCKIDLKRAIQVVQPRKVFDAQLRLKDGEPVVRVKTLFDGAFMTLLVDGITGRVIDLPVAFGPITPAQEPEFQSAFAVDKTDLVPHGRNPFFVLEPGWQIVLEGLEGEDAVHMVITILDETRVIDGVECAVLEERESVNDELAEVSRNFFAISKKSNAVYYFGEEVDDYEDGKIVSHGGEWQSGEDGARFGLFMPGTPVVGSRFYNEHAPRRAMDRVEILSVSAEVETPAGTFEDCVRWRETTPLEPGVEDFKAFARGIGFVQDGPLLLIRYGKKS